MQKVLFIDRDGTLVIEPKIDYQLDSLEKLEFYPGVFQWLSKIAVELDYELVMVTNQDGLGTSSFPEETFWPAQNKIIQAQAGFDDAFIVAFDEDKEIPDSELNKYLRYEAQQTNDINQDIYNQTNIPTNQTKYSVQ